MMPLLPLLISLAPTVASWILGDKTGAAVEKVTGIAREVLGTDTADGIERAIAADPNAALQFKQALIQAEAESRQQAHEEVLARLIDVQSARNQTVSLAQVTSPIAWGAPMVSVIVTAGFFSMLYLVLTKEIPDSSQRLADIMLGWRGQPSRPWGVPGRPLGRQRPEDQPGRDAGSPTGKESIPIDEGLCPCVRTTPDRA